jgi:hypothetical protein
MTIDQKLDFWIKNNWNAMFIGAHGIGKTAIIEKAFERANLNWQYFSAPTMDPWVDLVGVPKEKIDPTTGVSYLDLIRPRAFEEDTVEAIFIDEFNRAQEKTTNAIMELLQFKSINGHKFHNLRFVWAAINPSDDEGTYHVNPLDPAVEDRFIVQFELPSEPSLPYFIDKYGQHVGSRAVDWWYNTLPSGAKKLVSPRRLDYAVGVFQKGGDLEDVLKAETRPKTLRRRLEQITSTSEHSNRWLTDPDTYITEITDRQSSVPIVDAFKELMDISVDQAFGYIPKLPAPKLNELATDNQTATLLLRHLKHNKGSRRVQTALTRNVWPMTESLSMSQSRYNDIKHSDLTLYALLGAAHDGPSWGNLRTELHSRMTTQLIEFEDCVMVLHHAASCGTIVAARVVVSTLTEYVITNHSDKVVEYLKVAPVFICDTL